MRLQAPRGPARALSADNEAAVRKLLAESSRGEPEFELVGAAAAAAALRAAAAKVIALSGDGDRTTVFEMLQVGVAGYPVKGGPIEETVQAIKGASEGRGSFPSEVTTEQRADRRHVGALPLGRERPLLIGVCDG